MGLLIEQQLVALSEATKHKSFAMDAERIRNLLMEAAKAAQGAPRTTYRVELSLLTPRATIRTTWAAPPVSE